MMKQNNNVPVLSKSDMERYLIKADKKTDRDKTVWAEISDLLSILREVITSQNPDVAEVRPTFCMAEVEGATNVRIDVGIVLKTIDEESRKPIQLMYTTDFSIPLPAWTGGKTENVLDSHISRMMEDMVRYVNDNL